MNISFSTKAFIFNLKTAANISTIIRCYNKFIIAATRLSLQDAGKMYKWSMQLLNVKKSRLSITKTSRQYSVHVPRRLKSWVPTEADMLQKITTQALLHEVSLEQMNSAATVVPWFLKNMPAAYFRQTAPDLRKQHLKAIQAFRDLKQSDLSLRIETKYEGGNSDVTWLASHASKGLLHEQITEIKIPPGSKLSRVKVFSSLDNEMALNIFSFYNLAHSTVQKATVEDANPIFTLISEINQGLHSTDPILSIIKPENITNAAMEDYLSRVSSSYVSLTPPNYFLLQNHLFNQVKGTDDVAVHIQTEPVDGSSNGPSAWITIAASNVLSEVLLQQSSMLLATRNLDINRAHLDTVSDPSLSIPDCPQSGYVTLLRILVSEEPSIQHSQSITQPEFQSALIADLKQLKWLDQITLNLGLTSHPSLGLGKAEIITGLCSMLHGPLNKVNPQAYSSIRSIIQILDSSPQTIGVADAIATLFTKKFKPISSRSDGKPHGITDVDFKTEYNLLHAKISKIPYDNPRILLLKMLEAVQLTLRTNFYNNNRYALSMRIHPSVMVNPAHSSTTAMPFGVIFCHGRHFNGFHCRFRDIARGGLRIVTPPNGDQHVLESSRQFDEAYGLSFAQQLKNKDIPEGGAKAVVLVNSAEIDAANKSFAVRKCVKAFTDSMLDLIVNNSVNHLVDYYNKDELIYLGPDEQVIPWDIDWIVDRAEQRGYPIPAAFMSSKKEAGINHKEFGVTSEGVVVYLDVALKNVLNIDPKKHSFTIKITGGPDGDVAGNLIRILFREYGDNCKVVGIADGFGVAEDPEGLNSTELLRLVGLSLPITSFDKTKLSSHGILLDASTDEGIARRTALPFQVKADAFVPAGGRPNTINGDNWSQFLDVNGEPSSPLIVEGANIFTTPEARQQLFDKAGVVIVKDSSANKCGVITSSCEVAASMLLTKEEFMAVKQELVHDVIVRLRVLARLEAELLFRAYKNYPGALPHFSERISNAIGKVTDAITDALQDVSPGDALFQELLPLIKENLPKKLAEVAWDRVPTRFPVQYQRNAIASTLASKLVYQEGILLVESQPLDKIAHSAIKYYREHLKIIQLAQDLEEGIKKAGLTPEQNEKMSVIVDLIKRGGARTSLDIF